VVPFVHITTSIEGRKDEELLTDLGGDSFPWIVFLDAKGEIAGKHTESNTPAAFARTAANVLRCRELKKKAAAGDATVATDIAILECSLGLVEFYELEEAIEGKKLTADQKKAVAQCWVNAAVGEGIQLARAGSTDDVIVDFVEIFDKGVLPTRNAYGFWVILVQHGHAKGDARILEAAIAGLREAFGPDDERANKWLSKFETRLAELKGAEE